jgi:hypothetical protein
VSSSSSHGSKVMPTDYDWVFCYSAYYPSYAGRRGDGIKWHDRKKVKNLHCIIKQQLEAFGVIYSWGLYTAVHLEIEADYLFAWPPITTQELVILLASPISFYKQVRFDAVAQTVRYLSTSMGPALAVKFLCARNVHVHRA